MSYANRDTNQDAPASGAQHNAAEAQHTGLTVQDNEGELIHITLDELSVYEQNALEQEPEAEGIELLPDLINSQGLLQHLVMTPYSTPVAGKGKRKNRPFTRSVVAGGRRLRALLFLVTRGRITLDERRLCRVVSLDHALVVRDAENSVPKAMLAEALKEAGLLDEAVAQGRLKRPKPWPRLSGFGGQGMGALRVAVMSVVGRAFCGSPCPRFPWETGAQHDAAERLPEMITVSLLHLKSILIRIVPGHFGVMQRPRSIFNALGNES